MLSGNLSQTFDKGRAIEKIVKLPNQPIGWQVVK